MNQAISIRAAAETDCATINAIYNHYVFTSTCTYDLAAMPDAARVEWFRQHGPKQPIIVAELDGAVVGWGSLSPFRTRPAYGRTVENSVYVHHGCHRKGIGSVLLQRLIELAREHEYHTIIAGVDAEQSGSMKLHENFGFKPSGKFIQVGWKFERWLDVLWYQLML